MKRLIALTICILFTATGCQITDEDPSEIQANTAPLEQVNSMDAYNASKVDYQRMSTAIAESKHLQPYSPSLYEELLVSWEKANTLYKEIEADPSLITESYSFFSSTTHSEEFTQYLAEVEEIQIRILKIKEQADTVLVDSIIHMQYLEKIDAAIFSADEYKALQQDYRELFIYIAEGDIASAHTQQEVFLNKAQIVEVNVVLAKFITPIKNEMKSFKSEGLNEFAAISFAKADAEINSAIKTLKANPRDLDIIEQAVTSAKFELAHAYNISKEVRLLSTDKEQVILAFEEKLLAISTALNGSDYRDQAMQQQSKLILDGIKDAQENKETATLKAKIEQLKKDNEKLTKSNSQQALLLAQNKIEIATVEAAMVTEPEVAKQVAAVEAIVATPEVAIVAKQVSVSEAAVVTAPEIATVTKRVAVVETAAAIPEVATVAKQPTSVETTVVTAPEVAAATKQVTGLGTAVVIAPETTLQTAVAASTEAAVATKQVTTVEATPEIAVKQAGVTEVIQQAESK